MARSMVALGQGFYTPEQTVAAARFLTVPDDGLIEDGTLYVVETPHPCPSPPENKWVLAAVGGWSSRRKLFTGSEEQETMKDERLDPQTESARIRAFFVDPAFARRGIARRLYERCERDALAAGFRSFALMATLPGVPLYHALGFRNEKPTDITLPDGSILPCVELSRRIGNLP